MHRRPAMKAHGFVKIDFSLLLILLLSVWSGGAIAAVGPAIPATGAHQNPIGRYAGSLREADGRLTLTQAVTAYHDGAFTAAKNSVLNFGIGSKPVWIHFSVYNGTAQPVPQRLSVETAWLDQVDVYFRHSGKTVAVYRVGDRLPFRSRPVESRMFMFDHAFAPGVSDVFLRVQTPDPMVVPMYLMPPAQAQATEKGVDYSYGFLYGFLFALLAYNAMLYVGLRDTRYIFYSLYLGMFLLMNSCYTGHAFEWLWPTATRWEQWSNPVLMMLYGASGLLFALRFLDIRQHFPRMHKAVVGYLGVAGLLLLLSILFDSQRDALLVAFTFVSLFTVIMLAMGVISVRAGVAAARYFLLAACSAMVGAALTALSVWGFIPFNIWTFRAVDIGMLLDATLLALALAYQFRLSQTEKRRAELLARLDPLTGLNNRRAFYDMTAPIWNIALRHDRNLSVILLDIDHFKHVNDTHGHAFGDKALGATSAILKRSIRGQDVLARWGGEEFIVLLPETDIDEAAAIAERLRATVAGSVLLLEGVEIAVTASFGVAQRTIEHNSLDDLISTADHYLYQSKDRGRNRICGPADDSIQGVRATSAAPPS